MYQFGIIHHSKYNYIVISIFKGKIKDDQITKLILCLTKTYIYELNQSLN